MSENQKCFTEIAQEHIGDPIGLIDDSDTEDNYDDFIQMIQDMKKHASENGGQIACADLPHQMRMGYVCMNTGKTWSIRLKTMKKCLDEMPANKKALLMRAFQTSEGKQNLVDVINGNIPVAAPTHQELKKMMRLDINA